MNKEMEKTIEQLQHAIEKNYRRLLVLLTVCLLLFIALVVQILENPTRADE